MTYWKNMLSDKTIKNIDKCAGNCGMNSDQFIMTKLFFHLVCLNPLMSTWMETKLISEAKKQNMTLQEYLESIFK